MAMQSTPDFIPPTDDGQTQAPESAAPDTGNNFIPSAAVTGGLSSQKVGSDAPVNQQDDTQVSPEEQRMYDDFVTRCKLFISDPRPPVNNKGSQQPNGKAPRDVIIEHLNTPGGQQAAMAVGRTAAQVITLITNNAKAAGYPYPPDVIFHGADEVISDLYQVGVASGVIKNPPPDNSPEEQHLMAYAKMCAAHDYGQNLIDTGQDTPDLRMQSHQQILDQIQKEGDSGALDHWNPSQHFSRQDVIAFMQKAAAGKAKKQGRMAPPTTIADYANRGHPQLVPPGGAPAPADPNAAPTDPSAAPPDASAAAPDPSVASPDPSAAPAPAPGGP